MLVTLFLSNESEFMEGKITYINFQFFTEYDRNL